ncbi:MAG: hypothetical protein ACRDSR_03775 [Pseudonocardiaceae bacterium]
MSAFETQQWETYETPGYGELESWGEMQEMELATELLEVSSEAELEQFLGKLIQGAAKTVGGFIKSPVGQALGGALKSVAKTALPMAAGALGNLVVPGVGGMVGAKLGSMASKLFELELEGMNEQEAELEVARRYVRFASTAARNAARAPSGAPPGAVARAAVVSAARRHAPGLVRGRQPGRPSRRPQPGRPDPGYRSGTYGFAADGDLVDEPAGSDEDDDAPDQATGRPRSGRWLRRGHKIVIYGV